MLYVYLVVVALIVTLCNAETFVSPFKLSQQRSDLAGITVGNTAIFVGGVVKHLYPNEYSSTADMYDFTTQTYSSNPLALSQARANMATAACSTTGFFAGGIYTSGTRGYTSSMVDKYDSVTKQWTKLTTGLSQPRTYLAGACASNIVAFGGGLLMSGITFTPSAVVDLYDTKTNTWTSLPNGLSQARYSLSAAQTSNKIVFAGGSNKASIVNPSVCVSTVDIYDITTQQWSVQPNGLSVPRCGMASVSVGHLLFFAGGNNDTSKYTTVVDIYNTKENGWLSFPNGLSVARANLACGYAANYVVFAGGFSQMPNTYHRTMDIYNIQTNRWISKPNGLSVARALLAAAGFTYASQNSSVTQSAVLFAGGLSYNSQKFDVIDVHTAGASLNATSIMKCTNQQPSNYLSYTYIYTINDEAHVDTRCNQCSDWFCITTPNTLTNNVISHFMYTCMKDNSMYAQISVNMNQAPIPPIQYTLKADPKTEKASKITKISNECVVESYFQTNI